MADKTNKPNVMEKVLRRHGVDPKSITKEDQNRAKKKLPKQLRQLDEAVHPEKYKK